MSNENTQRYADALANDMDKDCIVETTTGEISEMEDGLGDLMEDIENALSNAQGIAERDNNGMAYVLIRVKDSDESDEPAATADAS